MRNALVVMLLGLVTCLVACGGSEPRASDDLFDKSRSDVTAFEDDHGRALGLVNTTHGVLWDYEQGYSRFGADKEIVWGPLASIPDGELASMESRDALQSRGDVAVTAISVGTGSGTTVGTGTKKSTTVCTCCYVRLDKTCGCLECTTK
jgi:hypothetical protein